MLAHGNRTRTFEALFADITRFDGVLCALDPDWKWFHATSDDDLAHLITYVQMIKDAKFRLRLERAIDDFYLWRSARDETPGARDDTFDYGDTTVRRIDHFAENRYGVHFKDTNECGLYSFFVFDDGRISHYYYRCDHTFQEERPLNFLREVADDRRDRPRLSRDG